MAAVYPCPLGAARPNGVPRPASRGQAEQGLQPHHRLATGAIGSGHWRKENPQEGESSLPEKPADLPHGPPGHFGESIR